MIPSTPFRRLVREIVREEEPDYRMELAAVDALQLAAEVYLTTFLAGMTIYLSHELITQYSISGSNLAARHAGRVTIMEKDFLHVRRMGFLFGALDDDPDYKDTRKAEHIIQQYDAGNEISGLSQGQKNKIDAILTIRDWEYVITLIYHCNTLNNMNSDENYNSENDSNYPSSVEDSNCDSESDSGKDDPIPPPMQRTPRTVNAVISQMMQTNPAAAQFLAGHNQNN